MKLALPLALACTLFASAAHAEGDAGFAPAPQTGGGFGTTGQWVLSLGSMTDAPFFFHHGDGGWQLQLAPAADYFIINNVSVGGAVKFAHASGGGANADGVDTFGLEARAGYALAINGQFTFWPLVGLAVDHTSVNHTSSTSTSLPIFAPVLFHVVPHFFVGAGPSVVIGLSNGGNEVGLDCILGGWF
ncbi:MAG TPA: hypothetical protein VHJ20_09515 [Polyangia bacterium]|nr:hypothetical protein [Polyangia bacterium]